MYLTDDITDPRLAKALAHPLRLEILRRLGDRTASPSELAEEIGAPLTNVSDHVRKLRALGLIKLVRKTPKRGVIEHYYSAAPRPALTDHAWEQTPPIVKAALLRPVIQDINRKLADAANAGGFDRGDVHLSSSYMKLDLEAWEAIAKLLRETLAEIDRLEDAAKERLKRKPDAEILQTAALIGLFELQDGAGRTFGPT